MSELKQTSFSHIYIFLTPPFELSYGAAHFDGCKKKHINNTVIYIYVPYISNIYVSCLMQLFSIHEGNIFINKRSSIDLLYSLLCMWKMIIFNTDTDVERERKREKKTCFAMQNKSRAHPSICSDAWCMRVHVAICTTKISRGVLNKFVIQLQN